MVNVRPMTDKVFIKKIHNEVSKTDGGIIIPEDVRESKNIYTVVALGAGSKGKQLTIGDTVLVDKNHGVLIDEDYYILHIDSIQGILP